MAARELANPLETLAADLVVRNQHLIEWQRTIHALQVGGASEHPLAMHQLAQLEAVIVDKANQPDLLAPFREQIADRRHAYSSRADHDHSLGRRRKMGNRAPNSLER